MPEIKVQTDTKVIISLSEAEAGKLKCLLYTTVDFEKEDWARAVHDGLDSLEIMSENYEAI
jgi:hypothetical protein